MIADADLDSLLDRARSEVKRWGGDEPSLTHLAAVLADRWDEEFENAFGSDGIENIRTLLTRGQFLGGEADIRALFAEAGKGGRAAVATALRAALAADLDALAADPDTGDEPPRDTHASADPLSYDESDVVSAELTGPAVTALRASAVSQLASLVAEIEPRDDVQHRTSVIEALGVALTRREHRTIALIGERGSGRRAVMHGVAALLAGMPEPIPVVRLRHDTVGFSPARSLAKVLGAVKEPLVVVLEDFEEMARLGTPPASGDMLELVRTAHYHPHVRLVLILRPRSMSRLEAVAPSLSADLTRAVVSGLSDAAVRTIVDAHVPAINDHYGVTISAALLDLACGLAHSSDALAQPALALDRLDQAAARRRLLGGGVAGPADLDQGDAAPLVMPSAAELAEQLSRRVKGQDEAIKLVSERLALTRARLDLRPERPDGVFLFVGPTGVGKTELAREISRCVFGSTNNFIRLDMSEYSHDWGVSRLFGPAPGYVGSTEPENWLTTRIAAMPQCVLLLDEIEKAHPTIWNAFLQVFDAGRLTDSRGLTADFSTVVIVMTSNMGAVQAGKSVGFTTAEEPNARRARRQIDAVKEQMAPELVNRLDEIVPFNPLSADAIAEIAEFELSSALDRLSGFGWQVECDPGVARYLADTGYDPNFGARHLQRNLERLFLMPLSRQNSRTVRVVPADDGIEINEI